MACLAILWLGAPRLGSQPVRSLWRAGPQQLVWLWRQGRLILAVVWISITASYTVVSWTSGLTSQRHAHGAWLSVGRASGLHTHEGHVLLKAWYREGEKGEGSSL